MPAPWKHPETIVLHSGYRKDKTTNAVAVPIYQTTSYQFDDTGHASRLFGLQELGNIYTRIQNPTNAVLEERLATLEGGVAALALSSGQAASFFAIQNIASAGDNFVSSTDLYGGTWNLFANTFKTLGIEARFVDPADPEAFVRASDDKTRAWSKRFFDKMQRMPTMWQAGVYSAVAHYLQGIKDAGTDEPLKVAEKMREKPIDDFFARGGKLREQFLRTARGSNEALLERLQ